MTKLSVKNSKSITFSIFEKETKNERNKEVMAYFCARTGPDFMHPMYKRDFFRCLTSVSPSVAAAI